MKRLRIADCGLRIVAARRLAVAGLPSETGHRFSLATARVRPASARDLAEPLVNPQSEIRNPQCAIRNRLRRSFSLAESVIAVTVVGVMLVASLKTLGATRIGQQKMSERTQGLLLAQELMSEILQQYYTDPEFGLGSFGLGGDEVGTGSRALWEDVDDYHGRSESPPQRKNGTVIAGLTGWAWRVNVAWVKDNNLSSTSASETSVKRIIVTVSHNSVDVAALVAVRTAAGAVDAKAAKKIKSII